MQEAIPCDTCLKPATDGPAGTNLKLTVGFATNSEFDTAAMTLQALRMYQGHFSDFGEIVVVDNAPASRDGERLRAFCGQTRAKYVPFPSPVGTSAPRDEIFRQATGDVVVVIDSHVLLPLTSLVNLALYAHQNPQNFDLWHGPMVSDNVSAVHATHMEARWGSDLMYGVWGNDPRGATFRGAPFEIPMHGLGLFACRREAWLGFPPGLKGFGGEEGMIHEKFRQAGRKVLCLPFLRWWHLFRDVGGNAPFPVTWEDKFRNYYIWHRHLGLETTELLERFSRLGPAKIQHLIETAGDVPRFLPATAKGSASPRTDELHVDDKVLKHGPSAPLDLLFDRARLTPSDINEHCDTLRRLAAQCDHVTEFGVRTGVSTTALLAGRPSRLVSYDLNPSREAESLRSVAAPTRFEFRQASSLAVDIEPTDLLFLDTVHTEAQVAGELARHADRVRRYLVFHDTEIFGEQGEDGGPGIMHAVRKFLEARPEWSVIERYDHNHGLLVLSRASHDKPALPSLASRAWHFAGAVWRLLVAFVKFRRAGAVLRTRAKFREILAVCRVCERRNGDQCTACGCPLSRKLLLKTEPCPENRWRDEAEPAPVALVEPVENKPAPLPVTGEIIVMDTCNHGAIHSSVEFNTTRDGAGNAIAYRVITRCRCQECGLEFLPVSGETKPNPPHAPQ